LKWNGLLVGVDRDLSFVSNVLEEYFFLDYCFRRDSSRRSALMKNVNSKRSHDIEQMLAVNISTVAIETKVIVATCLTHEAVCLD
jgi:hypothetical protein